MKFVATNAPPETRAQKWGKLAVTFIASATAAGIFAVVGFVFLSAIAWAQAVCYGIAGICFVIFAVSAVKIIWWWVVIARR